MKITLKKKNKKLTSDEIAELADQGKDISEFFTKILRKIATGVG